MPTISKINTSQPRRISFKSAYIAELNSKYESMRSGIEAEVSKFLSTKDNVRKLGEGVGGEVFVFTNPEFQKLVLKRNKEGHSDNYYKEYENLRLLPTDKIGGQEAVARIYNTDNGEYLLVSSLAEGKPVSAHSNPFTEKNLQSIFTKMFELDKHGIYHGDLNGKNVLISSTGEVNFIDYQWTQRIPVYNFFSSEKAAKLMLPIGHFPENAQMLEMAAIPKYIDSLPDEKAKFDFIEMYLKAKAGYHNERYKFLKNHLEKGYYIANRIRAFDSMLKEQAKSLLFANPSDEVQTLEFLKIQFLSDYRDAFRHVDSHIPDRNILASTSPYLCAVSSVQNFRKVIVDLTPKLSQTRIGAEYIGALTEYGEYWYHNLVKFASETQDYVMRMLTKTYNSHEHKHDFYKHGRSPRVFPANRDLLSTYDPYYENFGVTLNMDLSDFRSFLDDTDDFLYFNVKDAKTQHKADKFYSLFVKSEDFLKDFKYLDYLNSMQVMILKLREFESYLRHETNLPKIQKVISNTLENTIEHVKGFYSEILSGLKYENARDIIVQGYEHMRKFEFKL